MTEDEFWEHIAVLEGSVTSRSAMLLTQHLAGLGGQRIEDFADRLQEAVRAVDVSRYVGRPVSDISDPPGAEPIPLVGTAVEHFMLAVVAAGREVHAEASSDPDAALSRAWPLEEADLLLDVVPAAYEKATGQVWAGDDILEAATEDHGAPSHLLPWCNLVYWDARGKALPRAYDSALDEVADMLAASPQWQRWWRGSGLEQLEIHVEFGPHQEQGSVRRGKRNGRAKFRFSIARIRGKSERELAEMVSQDLESILGRAASTLGLGPIPEVPHASGAQSSN